MIEITVSRKNSIVVETPVLLGAGVAGYDGAPYRNLLALDKFGALVTPPLTLTPRYPANGVRVVPMPAGFLLHTGLPNPGVRRALQEYESRWQRSILPIIVHLVAESPQEMEQMAHAVDHSQYVAGIEIGLDDHATMRETRELILAAKYGCDLPITVRLPLYNALLLSEVAQQAEADALVVAAPPRGTERAQGAGRLVGGRTYGAWLKALALRMVGRVAQYAEVPIIGAGGIHTPDDARDFIAAGAKAVQLDTIVWVNPKMAENIARNLGSSELTRTAGALADEWTHSEATRPPEPPSHLPELPPQEDDVTRDSGELGDRWSD